MMEKPHDPTNHSVPLLIDDGARRWGWVGRIVTPNGMNVGYGGRVAFYRHLPSASDGMPNSSVIVKYGTA